MLRRGMLAMEPMLELRRDISGRGRRGLLLLTRWMSSEGVFSSCYVMIDDVDGW